MDPTKKTALEKQVVLALLCVFGATLAVALKNLGVFGSGRKPQAAQPAVERVRISGTLVETIQEYQKKMEPQPEPQVAAAASTAQDASPPAYTAGELRDPMKSLLPEAPASIAETAAGQKGAAGAPRVAPPPDLMVRGVLWGGREPEAIINDDVYRVGDTVKGAKILSINPNGVTIEHQGAPAFYSTAAPLAAQRSGSQQTQWR